LSLTQIAEPTVAPCSVSATTHDRMLSLTLNNDHPPAPLEP
jgi:hypothetical protein